MNTSRKPSLRLQLLLGITLSLVAVALVFWKLNSTKPDELMAVNPGSAPAAAGTPVLLPASKDRVRKIHSSSSEIPPTSPVPSQSPFLVPQAAASSVSPVPSEVATAFHAGRAKLMRDQQQHMRQLAHATPEERHQSMEKWHEEHAADELAAQQQLAIQMGAESRPPKLHIPSAPNIPGNATPELREFLTARHVVMKDHMEMMNQLQNATPEKRHQAMEKWHEQNASRLETMQTAASRLSESQPPPHLSGN
jgi:hypothetical protein